MPRVGEFEDLTGRRFGRLTVVGISEIKEVRRKSRINRYAMWNCACDCGGIHIANSYDLKSGKTKSCGCLARENLIKCRTKHGLSDTRLYGIYTGIKNRCYNKNEPSYGNYGGRGIRMCEEWRNDFFSFYEWSLSNGYDESLSSKQCTIERIDVNGDYCPENCKWIPMRQQGWNKRNTRYVTYEGRSMSVAEASELSGINAKTIYTRLSRGHDPFIAQRKSSMKKVDAA